jgi:hypothetical protein
VRARRQFRKAGIKNGGDLLTIVIVIDRSHREVVNAYPGG